MRASFGTLKRYVIDCDYGDARLDLDGVTPFIVQLELVLLVNKIVVLPSAQLLTLHLPIYLQ